MNQTLATGSSETLSPPGACLWAPRAWLAGRWQADVLLRTDASGRWGEVTPGVRTPPAGAVVLAGPVLPGLVNAHSHAFQRAFAGLAERRLAGRDGQADDFWSWRDRMYGVALRITPEQLQAVAAQLFVELLRGGYTQVCEFHYLHHAPDGSPYTEPARMCHSLADAATDTGIGLTVLPVLYERAGFALAALRDDQRRFGSTAGWVHRTCRDLNAARRPHVRAGVAIHSLRAATPASMADLVRLVGDDEGPIHIHVAEQTGEVDDCLAHTGARPIEWLAQHLPLDARWHLVHATHALPTEIDAVAEAGAGVVICPSTEANLGDGLADLPGWLARGVPITVGSDSEVCRSFAEELRWLEYGQRLTLRQRNVAASSGQTATAARLFDAVLAGSGPSAGHGPWGLVTGARADVLVLDAGAPGLLGIPPSHTLDALVFATDATAIRDVYVAGRRVITAGRHADEQRIAARFADVMSVLWTGTDP